MKPIEVVPLNSRPIAHGAPSNRPSVILVSHVPPWPAAAGNEYRLARLIGWLEDTGYSVHYVYRPFLTHAQSPRTVRDLADRYPRTYVLDTDLATVTFATDLPRAYDAVMDLAGSRSASYERLFAEDSSRLQARALELTRAFAPDALIDLILSLVSAVEPVALIAQYIFMSRVVRAAPRTTLRMLDLIDVFSSKDDKVLRFGVDDSFAVSPSDEAYLLSRADVVIAIQKEEEAAVRKLAPTVRAITAGIDCPVVDVRRQPVAGNVLVVGSANAMNKAGLVGFIRYAWPTVLRDVPDAQLTVVGSIGMSLSGAEPNVRLLGRIDDLGPAYASAHVVINPAFAGTGIKVKTIEAIAHLCPIVMWPSGADGLPAGVRARCSIAENWSAFAHLIIRHIRADQESAQVNSTSEELAQALSAEVTYGELRDALRASIPVPVV